MHGVMVDLSRVTPLKKLIFPPPKHPAVNNSPLLMSPFPLHAEMSAGLGREL